MIRNSRSVAFIVSLFVSILCTSSCFFIPEADYKTYFTIGLTSLIGCFVVSYLVLELTVFKELTKVYERTVNLEDERKDLIKSIEKIPVHQMSNELFKYSEKKTKQLKKLKALKENISNQ